jgi:hypothetical protein
MPRLHGPRHDAATCSCHLGRTKAFFALTRARHGTPIRALRPPPDTHPPSHGRCRLWACPCRRTTSARRRWAAQRAASKLGKTRCGSLLEPSVHGASLSTATRAGNFPTPVRDYGERRVIACRPNEDDAIKQLSLLRERHEAREKRRMAQEVSRFHTSNSVVAT